MDVSDIISHKRNILYQTLQRIDNGVTESDVLDFATKSIDSTKYNSLLLQILLEIICMQEESDKTKRKALFSSMWQHVTRLMFKEYNPVFEEDALISVRERAAVTFAREIEKQKTRIDSNFMSDFLSDTLKLKLNECEIGTYDKYLQEFKEQKIIGKGGFGSVYKAEHKIDRSIYAIKKIHFKYTKDKDYLKVMREVKTLSTLNHLNVVSYNQSWFEFNGANVSGSSSLEDTENSINYAITSHSENEFNWESECTDATAYTESTVATTVNQIYHNRTNDSDDDFIVFQNDSCSQSNDIPTVQLSSDVSFCSSISDVISYTNSSSSELDSSKLKITKLSKAFNSSLIKTVNLSVILYIQMEYCDIVLKDWLNDRAAGRPVPFQLSVFEIFRDILNGVAYIHSKSILHRDLKPQNIYFSAKDNAMKIGDFGLATLSDSMLDQELEEQFHHHTSRCGTVPYAAPEQKSSNNYDYKVDMYSMGVILLELLMNANTLMELDRSLTSILRGEIPEKLIREYPEYVSLLRSLLSTDPDCRPSARDILSKPPFNTTSLIENKYLTATLDEFKKIVTEKDKIILEQQARIKELEVKIVEYAEKDKIILEQEKRLKELEDQVKTLMDKDSEKDKRIKELGTRIGSSGLKKNRHPNNRNRKFR